ncbi:hypothetical protein HT031_000438 [Scenedesmus sp. PABB004]|nr:hypothetical protein HT031_000438 [Scenedesmus sp. PABB004]
MADDRELCDAALLRVPFEALKRAAKERKGLVDEASEALAGLSTAAAAGGSSGAGAPAAAAAAAEAAALDALVVRLQGLKRKLADVGRQEADEASRCRARLEHLAALGRPPRGGVVAWSKQRLDRLLVDHMLRGGQHQSAARLAAESGTEALSEGHIFADARRVVEALRARDCAPALAWCAENRARLRKLKSPLEFKLRLQEFLELVRADQRLAAVGYARQHLAPWAAAHMGELQRALATLAFAAEPKLPRYRALFAPAAWEGLLELFHRELYRLHGLLPESALAVQLQAGLVALKSPPAAGGGGSREDPLHHAGLRALAEGLPYAKHAHSKLLCAVTRSIMSDHNPPMVLPNGYVYSQAALEQIAANNGGKVVCPRTGSVFGFDEARRAFIV